MPLIGHLYLIWISSFESTWFTSDFHTICSRFYPRRFLLFERKFVWFLLHNWNWHLLGIVLNYFGWLLVVLGGWKKKTKKNRFKSKKSDLNQINLIFLIFKKKNQKNCQPCIQNLWCDQAKWVKLHTLILRYSQMKRNILLFWKKKNFQLLVSLELIHQFSWCFLPDIVLQRPKQIRFAEN